MFREKFLQSISDQLENEFWHFWCPIHVSRNSTPKFLFSGYISEITFQFKIVESMVSYTTKNRTQRGCIHRLGLELEDTVRRQLFVGKASKRNRFVYTRCNSEESRVGWKVKTMARRMERTKSYSLRLIDRECHCWDEQNIAKNNSSAVIVEKPRHLLQDRAS